MFQGILSNSWDTKHLDNINALVLCLATNIENVELHQLRHRGKEYGAVGRVMQRSWKGDRRHFAKLKSLTYSGKDVDHDLRLHPLPPFLISFEAGHAYLPYISRGNTPSLHSSPQTPHILKRLVLMDLSGGGVGRVSELLRSNMLHNLEELILDCCTSEDMLEDYDPFLDTLQWYTPKLILF
jgi:hypothetical protein